MTPLQTSLGAQLNSLRQTWQARPASERRRLILGLSLIMLLSGYLLVDHWPITASSGPFSRPHTADTTASASLIDQALTRLPPQPKLTAQDWDTAAAAHGVVIQTLEHSADGWQFSGLLSQPEAFQQLSRWAAQQGVWPYRYQLSREAEGWQWQAQFMNLQAIGQRQAAPVAARPSDQELP